MMRTSTWTHRVRLVKRIRQEGKERMIVAVAGLHHIDGNERPYFTVTGELHRIRRDGSWGDDGTYLTGGRIEELIDRHFPELVAVSRLHLSDDRGWPMHAVENGRYWLGLTKWQELDREQAMKHFRVTDVLELERIREAFEDEQLGGEGGEKFREVWAELTERWLEEAEAAKMILRRLGGEA